MAAKAASIQLTLEDLKHRMLPQSRNTSSKYILPIKLGPRDLNDSIFSPEDSEDPLEIAHLEDVERTADGEVPLERERDDRQNRRI